jgi:hypothetical protein
MLIINKLQTYMIFIGAVAKFRKKYISFVIYVCLSSYPSLHTDNSAPTRRIFIKIWYLRIFRKFVRENPSFIIIWQL